VIHRYWTGPATPPAEPWLHHVIANLHPADTLTDWTDDTLPADLVDRLARDRLGDDPRHRANIVRWSLLHLHGGVWLDHDLIPLRPLPAGAWTASLGGARTGCAISLPAGHTLPAVMLDVIDSTDYPATANPVDVSGDRLLQRVTTYWPDLAAHQLPFDAAGRAAPTTDRWAVHLWSTSAARHLRSGP
jgi:hypothetical protein